MAACMHAPDLHLHLHLHAPEFTSRTATSVLTSIVCRHALRVTAPYYGPSGLQAPRSIRRPRQRSKGAAGRRGRPAAPPAEPVVPAARGGAARPACANPAAVHARGRHRRRHRRGAARATRPQHARRPHPARACGAVRQCGVGAVAAAAGGQAGRPRRRGELAAALGCRYGASHLPRLASPSLAGRSGRARGCMGLRTSHIQGQDAPAALVHCAGSSRPCNKLASVRGCTSCRGACFTTPHPCRLVRGCGRGGGRGAQA